MIKGSNGGDLAMQEIMTGTGEVNFNMSNDLTTSREQDTKKPRKGALALLREAVEKRKAVEAAKE